MFELFAWANKCWLAAHTLLFVHVPVVTIVMGKSLLAFCTFPMVG